MLPLVRVGDEEGLGGAVVLESKGETVVTKRRTRSLADSTTAIANFGACK